MNYQAEDIIRMRTGIGYNQTEFAKQLKISRELLNKIEGGTKSISKATQILLSNLESKIKNGDVKEVPKVPEQKENTDTTTRVLLELANANNLLAQSNKTLADNNKDLIQMFKSTVGGQKQTDTTLNSMIPVLLELIAEVASGEASFRSKYEAATAINKRFSESLSDG